MTNFLPWQGVVDVCAADEILPNDFFSFECDGASYCVYHAADDHK
jgi:hypothetical protein